MTPTIALISLIVQSLTAIGLAWIAYKHASLSHVIQTLEINTNSIKDALVAAARKQGLAEGNLIGRLEQTEETKDAKDTIVRDK